MPGQSLRTGHAASFKQRGRSRPKFEPGSFVSAVSWRSRRPEVATLVGEEPTARRVGLAFSTDPTVKTDQGVSTGSTAEAARARYPGARVGNPEQGVALSLDGTPGVLKFTVDVDFGQPVPDNAPITGIAVVAAEMASNEEYCA